MSPLAFDLGWLLIALGYLALGIHRRCFPLILAMVIGLLIWSAVVYLDVRS